MVEININAKTIGVGLVLFIILAVVIGIGLKEAAESIEKYGIEANWLRDAGNTLFTMGIVAFVIIIILVFIVGLREAGIL